MRYKKLIILTVVILAGAVAVIAFISQLGHSHDDGSGHEGHDHSAAEVYEANAETEKIAAMIATIVIFMIIP